MKEITSSQGGRYRYNEDINALQESALAITEFFKQIKGNFVISGCQQNGDGYVWIDGKIRYVEAKTPSIRFNYIIAEDTDGIDVEYHNKEMHKMNVVYGAKYSTSPSSFDKTISILSGTNTYPRIGYALFNQYSIDKDTVFTSVVDAPMNFSNILEANKFNLNVGSSNIRLAIQFPYLIITFRFGINNKEYSLKLPFEKKTVHFEGEDKEWSVSNVNENENDDGTLRYGSVVANTIQVRNACNCADLQIKTDNGKYQSISEILQYSNAEHHEAYRYAIDTSDMSVVKDISISQYDNIVTINGIIPIKYITGAESSSCHVGDPFYLDNLMIKNKYHLETTKEKNGNLSAIKIRTSLRLPIQELYPNEISEPGAILCSDMTDYSGAERFNGNIQLMIDKSGYFNLIVTATSLNRDYVQFVLNGYSANDGSGKTILGPAFNLTYVL